MKRIWMNETYSNTLFETSVGLKRPWSNVDHLSSVPFWPSVTSSCIYITKRSFTIFKGRKKPRVMTDPKKYVFNEPLMWNWLYVILWTNMTSIHVKVKLYYSIVAIKRYKFVFLVLCFSRSESPFLSSSLGSLKCCLTNFKHVSFNFITPSHGWVLGWTTDQGFIYLVWWQLSSRKCNLFRCVIFGSNESAVFVRIFHPPIHSAALRGNPDILLSSNIIQLLLGSPYFCTEETPQTHGSDQECHEIFICMWI